MDSECCPQTPKTEATRSPYQPSTPLSKEYLEGLLAALNAGDNLANLQATHLWADIINCIDKFPTASLRYHVRTYKHAFTGSECVMGLFTFLQAKSDIYPVMKQPNRDHILSLCQQLLDLGHLQAAVKSSKAAFHSDTHPYRFCRHPIAAFPLTEGSAVSSQSSDVSVSGRKRRGHRYHPYLKKAKDSVKKFVHKSRDKKVAEEEEHEWVDTIMSRILTHVDMPYLDKVLTCREISDDIIRQNLASILTEEEGYIPQWIIRIFDWLSTYSKSNSLTEVNIDKFKINSVEEDFPSAILMRLSKHLDTSIGPLIHHSLFELFETIAMHFTGDSIPQKAIVSLQLFLLLPPTHKRLHLQFIFKSLYDISGNDELMCSGRDERLSCFLKLFMPCLLRSKERLTRRHSEIHTNLTPILVYMAQNTDTAFDVPQDIKEIYEEDGKDFSFQDFLSRNFSQRSPASKCVKNSDETETRGELKKLLDGILSDKGLTKEKREDLLHQFSVVYPEIYSQSTVSVTLE